MIRAIQRMATIRFGAEILPGPATQCLHELSWRMALKRFFGDNACIPVDQEQVTLQIIVPVNDLVTDLVPCMDGHRIHDFAP